MGCQEEVEWGSKVETLRCIYTRGDVRVKYNLDGDPTGMMCGFYDPDKEGYCPRMYGDSGDKHVCYLTVWKRVCR